jgi:chitosanase
MWPLIVALIGLLCLEEAYGRLNQEQKQVSESLSNVWLHDTQESVYHLCENLEDGQGLTCGRANFTTSRGDILQLVESWTRFKPKNPLARFLPELRRLVVDETNSSDVSNLRGFESGWEKAMSDMSFLVYQDETLDTFYYEPAMSLAKLIGVQFPLSKAVLYDTMIQHGANNGTDSIQAIVLGSGSLPDSPAQEKAWLSRFLTERRSVLTEPSTEGLRKTWPQTVDRIEGYIQIMKDENWDFNPPIYVLTAKHEAFIPKPGHDNGYL